MRVLGIDPGYAIVGWGVVEYAGNRFAPVDFGAVCTDAGVPFERRLDEVYTGIKEVIERTKPEVLAIEKLFYQHNQTTVIVIPCLCSFTALRTLATELVGARPLHLLTQTVLLLKHPTGVFVAVANANL